MKQISFVLLDEARRVVQSGHTDELAFARLQDEFVGRVVEVADHPALRSGDRLDPATGEVTDQAPPIEMPRMPDPTFEMQRAASYPNLGEFADAIYHRERGNPEPFKRWLAACDAVKRDIPKPEAPHG